MEVTPTQSLVQKTQKLKSLVQRVPTTKCYRDPLYKALETNPLEFIRYVIGTLDRKVYDTKIRCLAFAFSGQATILAHCVIALTIATLVAAYRGVHFLIPFIYSELMSSPPNPTDAEPLGPPVCSNEYQTNVHVKYRREWTYLMHLLQYWYNAGTVYTYRGPIRQENKLMLFVYYRINAMLNPYSIFIQLHEVMDKRLWRCFLPGPHPARGLHSLLQFLSTRYLWLRFAMKLAQKQISGGS